ncbi:flagellar export protein FliJ [Parvibaculum sp.]|jgi:flagellar export protein FliJ|uniref:flagellar export protein FliJ n=1 Tax=Parvibaculum sp. TaxID=2024848 RepID=UPI000C90F129|nr:flagellar export protein FliJ [Parvibaculum sp.]MAB15032.1 flagellar export protein FliJ [Parvibaculum sp.]
MRNRESLIRLHKFQVDERRRKVAEIELLLTEFRNKERELEAQVLAEQEKAGISDEAHFAYPMFAKSVQKRRTNILQSIADLEVQLGAAQEELAAAFRELKKYELMEESRKRKMQKQTQRLEQAALDEIALQIHRRS